MSPVQHLRELVKERLAVAAEEICREFEKTIDRYEREIQRQQRLLDSARNTQITINRIGFSHERDYGEDVQPNQLPRNRPREHLLINEKGETMVVKEDPETIYEGDEPNMDRLLSHSSALTDLQHEEESWHADTGSTDDEDEPRPKKRRLPIRSYSRVGNNSLMTANTRRGNETDVPQLHAHTEHEVLAVQQRLNQEVNSSVDQEEHRSPSPQVKEEQQLGMKAEPSDLMVTSPRVNDDDRAAKANSDPLLFYNTLQIGNQVHGEGAVLNQLTEAPVPEQNSSELPDLPVAGPSHLEQLAEDVSFNPFNPPIDPADWPSVMSDAFKEEMVKRGPFQVNSDFKFPRRKDSRSFRPCYFYRTLANGEKIKRTWLMYSIKNDAVYCFCCKLFSRKEFKLMTEGLTNWTNLGILLKSHENSPEHGTNLKTWKDFQMHQQTVRAIDQAEISLLEAQKRHWRDVLTRLISVIQSLAERNLALRGTANTLHQQNNGNFLKEVELLAKFDPVMKQHIESVESGELRRSSYLGHVSQNELIASISKKMLDTMVKEIKQSKYYSIILDCSVDESHQEQMSLVVRTVRMDETPQVKEHFMGFLVPPQTADLDLSSVILDRLKELNIPFDDCRGQAYINGVNLRGSNRGVQGRLLEKNPCVLYVPCGAHSFSFAVADAAKASTDAISYFGYVQKVFTLFSAAPQRWAILKERVTIALKCWSDTRWECHVRGIEALRSQASNIREALLEVREKATDPLAKGEAQSLAEEVGSYRFLICTVVWYEILKQVNHASKLLQSPMMQLDVAIDLLVKAKTKLTSYRGTAFAAAQASAKDMCEDMNVDAVLKEKRLRSTKEHFAYEAPDEPMNDAMKRLETAFFNVVVDTAIESLKDRIESLSEVSATFGMLLNFKKTDGGELGNQCDKLSNTLKTGNEHDIDGKDLAQEIRNLPSLPSENMTALELLSFIHTKHLKELYPNLWIALRIACTLPVIVASAEKSFSKLRLIKSYLKSPMGQDRLTRLAIISINHEIGKQLSYDDIIDDFASKKVRKQKF